MSLPLIQKILRDIRFALVVVALLLGAFQCFWAKITQRIAVQLMPLLQGLGSNADIENTIFSGPGKIMRTMMGGESISLFSVRDMITIGYVHPLMLTVFAVWAIGRSSGAIAGEIDRGTMELLLAQPLARFRLVMSHLVVDLVTLPLLCLSLWAGNWLGIHLVELRESPLADDGPLVDAAMFGPALWYVFALMFAIAGYTMWLSALGRFRTRVLAWAVLITLVQFLVQVVGQLWDSVAFLRPFTVYFYYQPQNVIIKDQWTVDLATAWRLPTELSINGLVVLLVIGAIGYAMALWTFSRRDLPAPL
jgi:ABC-2 type transport system permease protein